MASKSDSHEPKFRIGHTATGGLGTSPQPSDKKGEGRVSVQDKEGTKHYYGCVHCRKYHYEGQAVYKEHFWWQTVHGVKELSEKDWAMAMLKGPGDKSPA